MNTNWVWVFLILLACWLVIEVVKTLRHESRMRRLAKTDPSGVTIRMVTSYDKACQGCWRCGTIGGLGYDIRNHRWTCAPCHAGVSDRKTHEDGSSI